MARFAALLATLVAVVDAKAVLNIIRHGEKCGDVDNGLSVEGQYRAEYLAKCMSSTTISRVMPYGKATTVMASQQQEGHTTRPIDTVFPLAAQLGLELQTPCLKGDADCFAKEVQKMLSEGGTIVAGWTNDDIPDMLESISNLDHKSIAGHKMTKWTHDCPSPIWAEPDCASEGKSCYDEIWQVIFDSTTSGEWIATDFNLLREGFAGLSAGQCLGDLVEDKGFITEGGSCQLMEWRDSCGTGLVCEEQPEFDGKHIANMICVQPSKTVAV